MKTYSDRDIIIGIYKEDRKIFLHIYNKYFPMIEKMVLNLGGRREDAQDIFQNAMLAICRKIKAGEMILCCKFSTYLYAISKKIWIQELNSAKFKNRSYGVPEDTVSEPEPDSPEKEVIFAIFEKHMKMLSKDCQKILRLHFNRANIEQINKIMGYGNTHHTMDRKYRCKQSLMKRILNDPDFKELNNESVRKNRTLY